MQILQATHFKLHFGTICHFFMVSLNWYPNLPCYHTSIISLRMNHISFFDSLMYSSQVHLLLNGQNPCSCAWWPSFADLRKCYWCDTVKTLHIFLFWGVFSTLISYHCIWLKLNHLYEPSNSTGLEKKECKNVDTISPGQGFGFWHFNNASVLYSFSVFVQKWSKKKKNKVVGGGVCSVGHVCRQRGERWTSQGSRCHFSQGWRETHHIVERLLGIQGHSRKEWILIVTLCLPASNFLRRISL